MSSQQTSQTTSMVGALIFGSVFLSMGFVLDPEAFVALVDAQMQAMSALAELRFQDVPDGFLSIQAHWTFWWFIGLGFLVFGAAYGTVLMTGVEEREPQQCSKVDDWERENL